MAKHDTDPVLAHLVAAVNESVQVGIPVTVSAHSMYVFGVVRIHAGTDKPVLPGAPGQGGRGQVGRGQEGRRGRQVQCAQG